MYSMTKRKGNNEHWKLAMFQNQNYLVEQNQQWASNTFRFPGTPEGGLHG